MSVEPGNRLWNRLLARAEARAAKGTPPEPHHYRPVSASDDHLRSSFENSLIYHGLKIETEFNLRLQPTPRKRKTKRKSDLPIAERLRNDRAAAGSPGPSHRTPTGTPTRRISKSTPLSRPPIPIPPPLPPIPVIARAAASRERVLNAVSDDDGPPAPRPRNPPVVELSDSSDDAVSLARSAKPDSGSGPVLPHFDPVPDSNDISLWEEDAILVGQPPKVDESHADRKLNPKDIVRDLEKKKSAQDFRAPYKTSKQDRARRARARKIADSDSSLAGDSDSGKSKHTNESRHQGKPTRDSSSEILEIGSSSDGHRTTTHRRNLVTSKAQPSGSSNGESFARQEGSKEGSTVENHTTSDMPGSKRSLLTKDLLARITRVKKKDSKSASRANHVVCLSSSSDEEHPNNYRSNPPMRALLPRRRTPPNVSVEDKLFGRLSPLNSPRRRTRSMSNSKKRSSRSDVVSSPVGEPKTPASRRKDLQDGCETSEATREKTKRPTCSVRRRVSRRLLRDAESRKRSREEEAIATSSTDLKAATPRKSSSPISSAHQQKRAKHSVEGCNLGELSDEIFDVDLMPVEVNKIQNLPKNIKRHKTPPSSSLSESTIEVEESTGDRRNPAIRRKSRSHGIPLSVNATFPGQHRVTPKVLETTGNAMDVLEILDGDSDVCPVSVSPVMNKRRVTKNNRGCKRVDIPGQKEKDRSKGSSTKSVSPSSIQSPETTKQENHGDNRSGFNRGLPLQFPRSVTAQEHRNQSTKDSSMKSTSPSSDSSPETIKQDTQRHARTGVNRRISSRVRRHATVQEHRKESSEPTKEKNIENSREICRSPAIDLRRESKQDIQASFKPSLPLRIRRRTATEGSGTASSKSPRGRSSDKVGAFFRSPAKIAQKQAKRDAGSSSNPGLPLRNRKRTRTVIHKQKKISSITPRGRVWDDLPEKMKQRIQKALKGEADYYSDDSFDSELSERKGGRKYAVYHDGRVTEITD